MRNRTEIYAGISLKAYGLWLTAYGTAATALQPAACGLWRPFLRGRKGQTVVEYLLMLAVAVGMALTIGVLFYKRIIGGLFTLVGMVIGAGTPASTP